MAIFSQRSEVKVAGHKVPKYILKAFICSSVEWSPCWQHSLSCWKSFSCHCGLKFRKHVWCEHEASMPVVNNGNWHCYVTIFFCVSQAEKHTPTICSCFMELLSKSFCVENFRSKCGSLISCKSGIIIVMTISCISEYFFVVNNLCKFSQHYSRCSFTFSIVFVFFW